MRRAPVIELTDTERETLERWAHGQRTELRLVERARMILLAAEGRSNQEIAAEVKASTHKVGRWRLRFAERRCAGIERDAPRPGRKPVLRDNVAGRIIEATTQERPAAATHWSTRTLAQHLGVKRDMVRRVWKAAGLKPHRIRTFKLSNDPRFVEKVVDVVGLYLNPPEHALVLSVDEKSQIQALDRTQPGLPLKKGRCGTRTHDYVRNGTTTLFAALNVADGRTIGTCLPRHRHQEWLTFLRQIDRQTPPDLDLHLILDNYQTHKHPTVKKWLARRPRFHMHFIPTSSSWLNLIERWFRNLTDKSIRRGVFRSVPDLIATIERYIQHHNGDPQPLVWTAQANQIIAKIARAKAVLNNVHH